MAGRTVLAAACDPRITAPAGPPSERERSDPSPSTSTFVGEDAIERRVIIRDQRLPLVFDCP